MAMKKAKAAPDGLLLEIGTTGLKRWGGFIREEFLRELQGQRGMKVYREMRDNSAIVGACLGAVQMLIRQVNWRVEPFSQEREDLERAEHFEQCRNDMSFTWAETIAEHLTMLPYGFAYHELVYKRRGGDVNDPTRRSRHSDGRIGWRKIPLRAQDSLAPGDPWILDDAGGVQAMRQVAPPDYKERVIPIGKALHFRAHSEKNNPEGRSILRNSYFAWYFAKKICEIEGIGIARDLAGLPIGWLPPDCFGDDAGPNQKATKEAMERIVTSISRDEQEGVVLPLDYQAGTANKRYDLTLLSTGGRRQFDTSVIVERWEKRIAMTMLQDLVLMGSPNTVQYKGKNMPNLFATALGGWLDVIAEVYNLHAIPRLMVLNGWPSDRSPRLCHGSVEAEDLGAIGQFITAMTQTGFRLGEDEELEQHLRRLGGLPRRTKATPPPPPVPVPAAAPPSVDPSPAPGDPGADENREPT